MLQRLERLWLDQIDPRTNKFAFINGTPLEFVTYVVTLMVVMKVVFTVKNDVDFRPFRLILNGFIFGAYSVGIMFGVWLSNGGRTFFDCSPLDLNTNDVREWFTIYVAYIFIIIKTMELMLKLMPYFLRKPILLPPMSLLVRPSLELIFVYLMTRIYPGNISFFCSVIDGVVSTIHFAHETLVSASSEMKPVKQWPRYLLIMRYIQHVITFAHGLYFVRLPQCSAPRLPLTLQTLHSFTYMFVMYLIPYY